MGNESRPEITNLFKIIFVGDIINRKTISMSWCKL